MFLFLLNGFYVHFKHKLLNILLGRIFLQTITLEAMVELHMLSDSGLKFLKAPRNRYLIMIFFKFSTTKTDPTKLKTSPLKF